MASSGRKGFPSKVPAMLMGILMELFLLVFRWPVAQGEGCLENY